MLSRQSHKPRTLLYVLPSYPSTDLQPEADKSHAGLGFFPGLLHAWYIIATHPDPTYDELAQQDPERDGTVTYYYVQQSGGPQYAQPARGGAPPARGKAHNPQQQQQQGYGTVNSSAPNAQFPASQQEGFVQPQAGGSNGEGAAPPPSYQQAVEGDHKVQRP